MPEVDLSEFETLSRTTPTRCKMARNLDALSPEDREKCEAALKAEHISHFSIQKWLAGKQLRIHHGAVKKHRDSECCCER